MQETFTRVTIHRGRAAVRQVCSLATNTKTNRLMTLFIHHLTNSTLNCVKSIMACLLLVVVLARLVSTQHIGQRVGPATSDARGMQGQQGFPPGAAIGDAWYGKLTVRYIHNSHLVRCLFLGGASITDRPVEDPPIVTPRPRHMEAKTMA